MGYGLFQQNEAIRGIGTMSEEERIELSNRITEGILKAQRALLERKAKLGETVVWADENAMPLIIPAQEALRQMNESENQL